MSKSRVLFITQEMNPYTTVSEISELLNKLVQTTQNKGIEIRVLMPKFGSINERRHRLHEVVRLSGMNIIVDDEDYPLIIKVASLPGARLQVYFLDNEEFFKRKFVFDDADGNAFEDNPERTVFFCKSALETVKKFGWAPDLVHCHGWMASLVPLYLKTVYKDDPIFHTSKVIYGVNDNPYHAQFTDKFLELAAINDLTEEDMATYVTNGKVDLVSGAIRHADALTIGSENLSEDVSAMLKDTEKPTLEHSSVEENVPACVDFYKTLIEQ